MADDTPKKDPAPLWTPAVTFVWPPAPPAAGSPAQPASASAGDARAEAFTRVAREGHAVIRRREALVEGLLNLTDRVAAAGQELPPFVATEIAKDHASLSAAVDRLCSSFEGDAVGEWWLAASPPAFEPRAASLLEAVLRLGLAVLGHYDEAAALDGDHPDAAAPLGVAGLLVVAEVVLRYCPDPMTGDELAAALRCEAGQVSRTMRDVVPVPVDDEPQSADCHPITGVIGFDTHCETAKHIPDEWPQMTWAERLEAVRRSGPPLPVRPDAPPLVRRRPARSLSQPHEAGEANAAGVPYWDRLRSTLWFRGQAVRMYRPSERATTQHAILKHFQDAGWPEHIVYTDEKLDECMDPSKSLEKAVGRLNDGLTPNAVRFGVRGGNRIHWRPEAGSP